MEVSPRDLARGPATPLDLAHELEARWRPFIARSFDERHMEANTHNIGEAVKCVTLNR